MVTGKDTASIKARMKRISLIIIGLKFGDGIMNLTVDLGSNELVKSLSNISDLDINSKSVEVKFHDCGKILETKRKSRPAGYFSKNSEGY
jgi:hypothetical protein